MIQMPHRSVTRFFIPLIDVMILLFCIFLLLPIFKENDPENPDAGLKKKLQQKNNELEQKNNELVKLRADLATALKGQRPFQERFAIRVLEFDPRNGQLLYYSGNPPRPRVIGDAATAHALIEEQQRYLAKMHPQALRRPELHYLFLLPRVDTAYPTNEQLKNYKTWFEKVSNSPGP